MARKPKPTRRTVGSNRQAPSISELIAERTKGWRNLAITASAMGAVAVALWSGIIRLGWDPVVSSSFAEYKTEVDRKITNGDDNLRKAIIIEVDTRILDITTKITSLQDAVSQRKRDLHRFQIENLEAQDAQITWSQLPQINANIVGIERQLVERPGDTWLSQRKAEVENARKNIETRQADIRARIKALREQQ